MRDRLLLVPGGARLLAVGLPLLIGAAALLGSFAYRAGAPPPPPPDTLLHSLALPPAPALLVQVSGAVAHPGIYRLTRGDRVYAAVSAAGGIGPQADPNRLPDMAARLRDGQQVKVPFAGARTATGSKVDLNSASAEQLLQVPGFTPDLAAAAIDYRDHYGGFASARELVTVLGMGEADYVAAKPHLTT